MNVNPVTRERYDKVLRRLERWRNSARFFNRQRQHIALNVDRSTCSLQAVVQAALIAASALPAIIETHETLDACKRRQQGMAKAKAKTKAKAKKKESKGQDQRKTASSRQKTLDCLREPARAHFQLTQLQR